ncbi:MAG TPA: hypothetical protein DC049_19715 [Spirochaetia bacterium]|nr:hypothetical protein [Spirochaetia bacterium]
MWGGGTFGEIRSLLKKKGYQPFYEEFFPMPSNYVASPKPENSAVFYQQAEKKARIVLTEILANQKKLFTNPLLHLLAVAVSRAANFGAAIDGRRIKINAACIQCKKCVNSCPSGNLKLIGNRIRPAGRCMWCMRCFAVCPEQAISLRPFSCIPPYRYHGSI